MAFATVDSAIAATASAPSDLSLGLDSIPTVDLQLLSQSELYRLSLCSRSTFDARRCDDVIIPKIDRSVFNESAGSRKQTYSRLRLVPASDSAATASPSSLRRRAPHLRPANHNPHLHFLSTDPENADNRQIVALLKQLFGVDSSINVKDDNMEQLIPIRVDDSDTMPQLANAVSTGQKRKRGRPRKSENAVILVENKVESQYGNDVSMAMNDIVVYENVEDRDEEIVNRDGVEVDLVRLGSMEDPYGEELRQKTEGMGTEEELLEFLKGLNGQWGSRRKKKRIVDASLFGNALPKGWRLLLSCKKKEGRVWLFCRRYISPNGRQFVSCKEISAYLLSLHGIQDANQPTCIQSNADVVAADKMAIVITADLSVPNEKREEHPVCQILSPAVAATSGNYEVQVSLRPWHLPAVQFGETINCEKCNSTFNCQDDFLHHQLSSHWTRRSKNGESVTDGVIIKGGKFECQFCHKTFDERRRYNGHIGVHIQNQVKDSDESQAANVEECVGSGSLGLLTHGNSMMQSSTGSDSNVAAVIVRKSADDLLNPYTPQGINDKRSGDYKELNDHLGRVDKSMDVDVTKSNLCLDSVVVLSNNESNDNCEVSGGANVVRNAVDGVKKSYNAQEGGFESYSPFPLDKKAGGDTNPITLLERKTGAISGSVSHSSNEHMESCDIDLDGGNFSHTMDELRLEENKVVDNETLLGFCSRNAGLDDSSTIGDKPHAESENHSCKNIGNANGKLIFSATESEQKIYSESIMLTPSGDKQENRDNNVYGIFPSSTLVGDEYNKTGTYGNKGHSSAESDKCAATRLQEERGIGKSRIVPSWNETGNVTGKFEKEVSIGIVDGHKQQKSSENSFPSLSGFEGSYHVEKYVDKVSARKVQEPQVNDAQNMGNSELIFPFSSGNDGISTDAVNNNKHERGFEFWSFFPSENGEVFSAENNRTSLGNHAGEESKREPSGSVLLAQSCIAEPSDEVYNMNKIFGAQLDECKINVTGNSKIYELCLNFDSRADSSGVELEKYGAKGFDMHSGINQTCGAQSNSNNISHVAAENPKEGRAFGIDLHDSSVSDKTGVFENSFNMVYPGRVWEGPKVDEVGNSGIKFMVGFGSSVPQPVEDVLAGTIWRTGEENLLRPDLTDTSTPLVQASNGFHTFDIISDKGHEGLYGVDHKYECNSSFEGLTLGRTEPTEYSFMTAQSLNPLPGESKEFSYNADTQGFDSSLWLGKGSLMQNITGQNQVPTVCVWCRNEFYQDPTTSGAEAGAIGSMCPACSSSYSPQFNVL